MNFQEDTDFSRWLEVADQVCSPRKLRAAKIRNRAWFKAGQYRFSLAFNRAAHALGHRRDWWNQVDEHVILGALPLKEHAAKLQDLGVKAVVSLVEPFERRPTAVAKPMDKRAWEALGIINHDFPLKDFHPVSVSQLWEVAKVIHGHIEAGHKTYVHCKAGRGRSAAAVLAQMVTLGGWNFDVAYEHLKEKRPCIKVTSLPQVKCLHLFYQAFHSR